MRTDRTETKPLRVAFYSRVSTTEQAKDGESLDVQRAALHAWAKMQNWQESGQYTDDGYSGTTDKRPQFQRLLADAQLGRFDAVAVAKIDRFMRNVPLFYQAVKQLEGHGVAFVSIQEGIDTSNKSNAGTGRLFLNILAGFAEFESARIGERVADARQSLRREGRWSAGRPCYGYTWNGEEKRFEIVESEAEVVRRIFDLYTAQNIGITGIVQWLNENGYRRRPRGNCKQHEAFWTMAGTWGVLKNPAYAGQDGTFSYPQIIDSYVYETATKKRGNARKVRRDPGKWVLQGRFVCGLCGHGVVPQQQRNQAVYRCFGRKLASHLDGTPRCTLTRVQADVIEKQVVERLWAICRDSEVLKRAVETALAKLETQRQSLGDTVGIEEQLTDIKGRKERVWDTYHDGGMPKERMIAKIRELETTEKGLMARLDNLDPDARTEIDRLRDRVRTIRGLLESGQVSVLTLYDVMNWPKGSDKTGREINIERARRVFELLDVKIVAYPDRFEIQGLIPTQVIGRDGAPISGSAGRTQNPNTIPFIAEIKRTEHRREAVMV